MLQVFVREVIDCLVIEELLDEKGGRSGDALTVFLGDLIDIKFFDRGVDESEGFVTGFIAKGAAESSTCLVFPNEDIDFCGQGASDAVRIWDEFDLGEFDLYREDAFDHLLLGEVLCEACLDLIFGEGKDDAIVFLVIFPHQKATDEAADEHDEKEAF